MGTVPAVMIPFQNNVKSCLCVLLYQGKFRIVRFLKGPGTGDVILLCFAKINVVKTFIFAAQCKPHIFYIPSLYGHWGKKN